MRTEIRGYLFSIRMFQVRQASDGKKTKTKNRGTNKRRRRGEKGGRGSVAVSLLHITVSMLKASLFSEESQNVSSVKRDAHTRTARGNQPCTGQIHFEASVQGDMGLDTNFVLCGIKFCSRPNAERTKLASTLCHVCNQWPHS